MINMATKLSDVVIRDIWMDTQTENYVESGNFWKAGVIKSSPLLNKAAANDGGQLVPIPSWQPLDTSTEANISSDDTGQNSTPLKITQGKMQAIVNFINQSWCSTNLATEMATGDPMDAIKAMTDGYFADQYNQRLIASIEGIGGDSAINHGSDMVEDISIDDGDNATATNLFNKAAYIKTRMTMGDKYRSISAVGMHSDVYTTMISNEESAYKTAAEGEFTEYYMNAPVIVDDRHTVSAAATSGNLYTTVLFGQGAFGFGEGVAEKPVAVEDDESAGNGAGAETLYVRKKVIIHPMGYAFNKVAVAGESPTIAELKDPSNWSRIYQRKNVPLALLVSNG